jgi:outer membrane immunogenic protein
MRRLHRYLTGTTAILALSLGSSAVVSAADLAPALSPSPTPVYTKAPLVPAWSWTGCYVGAQAGYGWGNSGFSDPSGDTFLAAGTKASDSTHGGLVGGQIGCDYQFAGRWVVGLEVADAWANINGKSGDVFFDGKNESFGAKTEQLGSVTGRLGYAWDRVLFYGKGGAAWGQNTYNLTSTYTTDSGSFNGSDTKVGWTAGGGIEWAFAPSWSARIEGNYYDLGSTTLNLTESSGATLILDHGTVPTTVKQQFETVTVGINYRFGH